MPKQTKHRGDPVYVSPNKAVAATKYRDRVNQAIDALIECVPGLRSKKKYVILEEAAAHIRRLHLEIKELQQKAAPPPPLITIAAAAAQEDPLTPLEPQDVFDHFSIPVSMPFEYPYPPE